MQLLEVFVEWLVKITEKSSLAPGLSFVQE
jgi:hypothetical protein